MIAGHHKMHLTTTKIRIYLNLKSEGLVMSKQLAGRNLIMVLGRGDFVSEFRLYSYCNTYVN
jgi:hypothetical protein